MAGSLAAGSARAYPLKERGRPCRAYLDRFGRFASTAMMASRIGTVFEGTAGRCTPRLK